MSELRMPEIVAEAEGLARTHGFENSCAQRVGELLRALAVHAKGPALDLGTGYGVSAAWMLSGLRADRELVTIDIDPDRHARVTDLFSASLQVRLLCGDWREALLHGPYDLVFVDVGAAKDAGADHVITATTIGGLIVLDDFTPGPTYLGEHDERWHRWMLHPRLATCELLTGAETAVILATRVS